MFEITQLILTDFQQNTRILFCPKSLEAVVVDPGGEVAKIAASLNQKGVKCKQIWLTHSHLDHCGGVAELKALTGASLVGHKVEESFRGSVQQICSMYGLPPGLMQNCPEPERYIEQGDVVSFSNYEFQVLFTPGHSPGHVCFYYKPGNLLLAGDTLFSGSIGRTDLPGGDHATLMESIRREILSLPDETRVLSGHGPDTTVGAERRSNPFITGEFK